MLIKAKQSPFGSLTFLTDCFWLFSKALSFTTRVVASLEQLKHGARNGFVLLTLLDLKASSHTWDLLVWYKKQPGVAFFLIVSLNILKIPSCQNDLLIDVCVGPPFYVFLPCVQFYECWMLVMNAVSFKALSCAEFCPCPYLQSLLIKPCCILQ